MRNSARVRNYLVFALAASLAFSSCPLPYKYSPEGYPGSAGAVDPSTPKISASPVVRFSESNGQSGELSDSQSATTSSNTSISLSSQTVGAVIYYTTNGTTPDPRASGTQKYSSALDLSIPDPSAGTASKTMVITATAIGPNLNPSLITQATINLQYPQAAAPVFSVPSGPYTTDLDIAITSTTPGAAIYYTMVNGNGPAPRPVPGQAGTTAYSGPITITGPDSGIKTIAAIAVKDQLIASATSSAYYSVTYDGCAAPIFIPGSGTYANDQVVMLMGEASSAIWYLVGGPDPVPNTSPTQAREPGSEISLPGGNTTTNGNLTLKAMATITGKANSPITEATYTFKAATPQSSHAGGTYNNSFTLDLASSTDGAKIYYVLNGGDPSNGTAYDEANPPTIGTNVQLRAIAIRNDYKASDVFAADYTFKAATPTFGLPGGQYDYTPYVSINTTTTAAGTTIYFTDDGSDPSYSLTRQLYTSPYPIMINGWATTLRAIAVCPEYASSEVSEVTYIIAKPAPNPFVGVGTSSTIEVSVPAMANTTDYTLRLVRGSGTIVAIGNNSSISITDNGLTPANKYMYRTEVTYPNISSVIDYSGQVGGWTLKSDGSPPIVSVTVPGLYATPAGYYACFFSSPTDLSTLTTANMALAQGGYIFIPYSYEMGSPSPGTVCIVGFDCNGATQKTKTISGTRYLYKTEVYLMGTDPRIIYTGQNDIEVPIDWSELEFK